MEGDVSNNMVDNKSVSNIHEILYQLLMVSYIFHLNNNFTRNVLFNVHLTISYVSLLNLNYLISKIITIY